MATVTITGNTIRGATTSKDNRTWQVRAIAYQSGGTGGGVITPGADWETLYPVSGVLTFTAEVGAVVDIKTPEGVPYRVRIPTSDAGLWDVIEAGVAYQPDVAQDNLNLAVSNAAPGFIAAELGLQTSDAISEDLADRSITFTDEGSGSGYFSVGGVPVSGTLVPPAATWSGVAGRPFAEFNSVKDFGAVGDGVADDTTAIEAAFAASAGNIYFPAGTYLYTGAGLSAGNIRIVGAGQNFTNIVLGATSYLVNSASINQLDLHDLTVTDGKGAVKLTYTGTNVIYSYSVTGVRFKSYTEFAISHESSDMPFWRIKNCIFDGANTTGTIGIALSGYTDNCTIENCSFRRDRIHIKVGRGGNNCYISKCDFVYYSSDNSSGPRASIWLVPETANTNAGQGLVVRDCKFGNELLASGDLRVVYADQEAGTSFGTRMPVLGTASTGYISGHRITDCTFVNQGTFTNPSIVFTTTPNVWGISVSDNYMIGGASPYFLEFLTALTLADRYNSASIFGPLVSHQGLDGKRTALSNSDGVGYLVDPAGMYQSVDSTRPGSGSSASYVSLAPVAIGSYTLSNATRSIGTDVYGGADAATFEYTSSAGVVIAALATAPKVGVPIWFEFDVKNPNDGNALSQFYVYMQTNTGGYIPWRRTVEVPSVADGWVSYAYSFVPRTTNTSSLRFGNSDTGDLKTVIIGRVRAYQAHERQIGGNRPVIAAAGSDAATTQTLANDLRTKLIEAGIISA